MLPDHMRRDPAYDLRAHAWNEFLEWEHEVRRRSSWVGDFLPEDGLLELPMPVAGEEDSDDAGIGTEDIPGEDVRNDTEDWEALMANMAEDAMPLQQIGRAHV